MRESPILRTVRDGRPQAIASVASILLLISGYLVGSHLGLWDPYVESGIYVCFDASSCQAPPRDLHVVGEFVTFSLLALGGISAFIGSASSILHSSRR